MQDLQRLASLELDDVAGRALQADLDAVVAWMTALPEGTGEAAGAVGIRECRLRPDEVRPSLPVDSMLRSAPQRQDGFLRVPLFVERET